MPTAKPDNVSLIPEIHMVEGKKGKKLSSGFHLDIMACAGTFPNK